MNNINIRTHVAVLICIAMLFTLMIVVNASLIPVRYELYVIDGRVDYKELYKEYFKRVLSGNEDLEAPTSSFTITVKRGSTEVAS